MCPVTCGAKQVCFSRKDTSATPPDQDLTPAATTQDDKDPKVYRIFDRIMHLRPKDSEHPTLICPRSSINKETLVSDCRKCQGKGQFSCQHTNYSNISKWQFPLMYNASWLGYKRANLLDCDQLAARLDSEQCAWNDSWVGPFTEDFNKSSEFSFSFWSKPAPTSRGMPDEFVLSVHFFADLVSPKTFFDLQEAHPYEEAMSRLDMPNVVREGWIVPGVKADRSGANVNLKLRPIISTELNHRGAVPFNREWTFYHISFRRDSIYHWQERVTFSGSGGTPRFLGRVVKKVVENWIVCLALNAMPRSCTPFQYEYYEQVNETKLYEHVDYRNGADLHHPYPELYTTFIEAFEVTAELLLSPIEVRTKLLSASQIQELYFKNAPRMKNIIGPSASEVDRLAQRDVPVAKMVETFPERIVLAAPPLLFQQRGQGTACNLTATQIYLGQQFDLVQASHCKVEGECPNTKSRDDVYKCLDQNAVTAQHYGLNTTTLQKEIGVADFLFTMTDNEVIVRSNQVLPAREFLDTETKSANIICLFYSPNNGDTTVLSLSVTVDGSWIKSKITTDFFGLIQSEQRWQSGIYYSAVLALCIVILFLNLSLFLESLALARKYSIFKEEDARKVRLSIGQMELREAVREEHCDRRQIFETQRLNEKYLRMDIFYDVFQVAIVLMFAWMSFLGMLKSEKMAEALAKKVANVPWTDQSVPIISKVSSFFSALDLLEENLTMERRYFYFGFTIMVLLIYRIMAATAIHPRLGILINTIGKGLDGLSHFAILFTLIFVLFSLLSWWSFAKHYDEFKDLKAAMSTQFMLFVFNIPVVVINAFEDPEQNLPLVIYSVVVIVLQSYFMCNFMVSFFTWPWHPAVSLCLPSSLASRLAVHSSV